MLIAPNLTCMFQGSVRTWTLTKFSKSWRGQGHSSETVKIATSNLMCMFQGTVQIWHLRNFFVWPGSRDPQIFWTLNANSSKMVRATEFGAVSIQRPKNLTRMFHDTLETFLKGGVARVTWPQNFGALNANSYKVAKAMDLKFDVCVSRVSTDMTPYKLRKTDVARVTWPRKFWALNANSSKVVKAVDFKFDEHVSRDSLDMTPYKLFRKDDVARVTLPQNFWVLNANSSEVV